MKALALLSLFLSYAPETRSFKALVLSTVRPLQSSPLRSSRPSVVQDRRDRSRRYSEYISKNRNLTLSVACFEEMRADDLGADTFAYAALIKRYGKDGKLEAALKLLEDLRKDG